MTEDETELRKSAVNDKISEELTKNVDHLTSKKYTMDIESCKRMSDAEGKTGWHIKRSVRNE